MKKNQKFPCKRLKHFDRYILRLLIISTLKRRQQDKANLISKRLSENIIESFELPIQKIHLSWTSSGTLILFLIQSILDQFRKYSIFKSILFNFTFFVTFSRRFIPPLIQNLLKVSTQNIFSIGFLENL